MLDEEHDYRLREALRAIPLTEAQVDIAARKLGEGSTKFLVDLNTNGIPSDSLYWDFKGKIDRVIILLGVEKQAYIKAVLKRPSLFYQCPETINANIEDAAALLGIEKSVYLEAALKKPALFCLSPDKVLENIEGAATLLGVEKAVYIEAALKQPSLFTQCPQTIYRNFLAAQAAHRAGFIRSEDLIADALHSPISLGMCPLNAALREAHSMMSKKTYTLGNFYTGKNRDKKTVEHQLHQGLSALFHRARAHAKPDLAARIQKLARHLHEQKITAKLPEFAAH